MITITAKRGKKSEFKQINADQNSVYVCAEIQVFVQKFLYDLFPLKPGKISEVAADIAALLAYKAGVLKTHQVLEFVTKQDEQIVEAFMNGWEFDVEHPGSDEEMQRLVYLAHEGLPNDCIKGWDEVKFCEIRQGDGNMCKHCSYYK